jgi:hypothetical protein
MKPLSPVIARRVQKDTAGHLALIKPGLAADRS